MLYEVITLSPTGGPSLDGPPRVAVLPFRDLGASDDATNFAAGMHDDILTQLSRIDALRVTSRTSVERYAGTDRNNFV